MSENEQKRRDPPISYRVPVAWREGFDRRWKKSGLSISAFLTQCIFDALEPRQTRRPAVEEALLADCVSELIQIKEALKTIAKEGEGVADGVDRAEDRLTELRNEFMSKANRRK